MTFWVDAIAIQKNYVYGIAQRNSAVSSIDSSMELVPQNKKNTLWSGIIGIITNQTIQLREHP